MMWHFVEEIEHRSSGLILCRHVNPDPWYRVKTPHHDSADQPLPDWAHTWMRECDRGVDMTTFVGTVGQAAEG